LTINLPLIPIADLCKVARNSLTLIANSKPKTFILTIAKEIKRINATSNQTTQNSAAYSFGNALARGKPEILLIIERLIDSQSQDVFELISDVILTLNQLIAEKKLYIILNAIILSFKRSLKSFYFA
jgi:hypothetical protein